jgi:hypothetical protein
MSETSRTEQSGVWDAAPGGATARGGECGGVGRRLVQARLRRRRPAVGIGRERGMPDRFDRAVLVGPFRTRSGRAERRGDGQPRAPLDRPQGAPRAAADPAFRPHPAQPGLALPGKGTMRVTVENPGVSPKVPCASRSTAPRGPADRSRSRLTGLPVWFVRTLSLRPICGPALRRVPIVEGCNLAVCSEWQLRAQLNSWNDRSSWRNASI